MREPGVAWASGSGGTYASDANWTGGEAPTADENAVFDLSSSVTYTVSLSRNEIARQAVIADDRVHFDLGGFQFDLTEANITRESLIVGERPGDAGELSITNGTLTAANVVVAHSTNAIGQLSVGTGGVLDLSGAMRVGSGGNGTLDVQSGAIVTSGGTDADHGGIIGQLGGTGVVRLSGAGTRWDVGAFKNLAVGLGGDGTLDVADGASLTGRLMLIGALRPEMVWIANRWGLGRFASPVPIRTSTCHRSSSVKTASPRWTSPRVVKCSVAA